MKVLIFIATLTIFACCAHAAIVPFVGYDHLGTPIGSHGGVTDTPEVAQAKLAHIAQVNYEAARNTLGYAPYYPTFYSYPQYYSHLGYGARSIHPAARSSYHHIELHKTANHLGAAAPIGPDGNVEDTPEVKLAKAAHFAAVEQERARHGLHPYGALAQASSNPVFFAQPYRVSHEVKVLDAPKEITVIHDDAKRDHSDH